MKRRQFISLAGAMPLLTAKAVTAALSLEDVQGSMSQSDSASGQVDLGYDFQLIEKHIAQYYLSEINEKGGIPVNDESAGLFQDEGAQQALNALYLPLTRSSTRKNLDWRVYLLDTAMINAFTPGGGLTFVYSGLIKSCDSEAQLASVLAHEIGHIEHKHAIRRLMAEQTLKQFRLDGNPDHNSGQVSEKGLRSGGLPLDQMMKYSLQIFYKNFKRMWEHQADALIIKAMLENDYPLDQANGFFKKLASISGELPKNLCIYSSHPENQERIGRLANLANSYTQVKTRGDSDAFRYLKNAVWRR